MDQGTFQSSKLLESYVKWGSTIFDHIPYQKRGATYIAPLFLVKLSIFIL